MNRFVTFLQLVVGVAAILASLKPGTITYRFSPKPCPNQRLTRISFLVVGVGLVSKVVQATDTIVSADSPREYLAKEFRRGLI